MNDVLTGVVAALAALALGAALAEWHWRNRDR